MQKLIKIFNAPYPLPTNGLMYKEVLQISGCISLLLILINFLGGVAIENWLNILVFLLVMTGSLILNILLLPKVFPTLFKPKRWVLWKELVWIFFNFISIAFYGILCFTILGWSSLTISKFVDFFGTTLAYGIGPVIILVVHRQNRLLNKHIEASKQLGALMKSDISEKMNGPLILKSIVGLKQIHVFRQDLMLLEASKNEVRIYTFKGGRLEEKTIRATLKLLEDQLSTYPEFIRCHRGFIINKKYISQIHGNAQGLKIGLSQTNIIVPVSRSYIEEFKNRLMP